MIETRGLRRTFQADQAVIEAVRGIDLDVAKGEVFGLLGPNGAGKSTTLRMLTTLLPMTAGEATVAGADLRREPARVRQRIGYVAQAGSTDPRVTGRRELVMQGRLYGLDRRAAELRAAALIDALQLTSAADRATGGWSGGMRRRLDVALGIVHRPPLLFLDEPTTGLDPQGRARMWEEIRDLAEAGTTILLTTHYLEEADALCGRIAIIDHGAIVAAGRPVDLKREIAGDAVTIGVARPAAALEVVVHQPFVRQASVEDGVLRLYVADGDTAVPQLLRLVEGAGLDVQTITMSRPTLADVFLRHTGRELRDTGDSVVRGAW